MQILSFLVTTKKTYLNYYNVSLTVAGLYCLKWYCVQIHLYDHNLNPHLYVFIYMSLLLVVKSFIRFRRSCQTLIRVPYTEFILRSVLSMWFCTLGILSTMPKCKLNFLRNNILVVNKVIIRTISMLTLFSFWQHRLNSSY